MPFPVRAGSSSATTRHAHIDNPTSSNTLSEIFIWEKIEKFFDPTNKPEVLDCIRDLCHPSDRTTPEDVANRFGQLKAFAHPGWKENFQSGLHGANHFLIRGEDGSEVLTATIHDCGRYTVENGLIRESFLLGTMPRLTPEECKAKWSEWKENGPPEQRSKRDEALRIVNRCLDQNLNMLSLKHLNITSIPDALPPHITILEINTVPLANLPRLPDGLESLHIKNTPLTGLPQLPDGLRKLNIIIPRLNHFPPLPAGLQKLTIFGSSLESLPPLPDGLTKLTIFDSQLASLPTLPADLNVLAVGCTRLTRLPALPPRLKILEVSSSALIGLPTLPPELEALYIDGVSPSGIPLLPVRLQALHTNNNRQFVLPRLPSGLSRLTIRRIQLASLPTLPSRLRELEIDSTPRVALPEFSSGLSRLTFRHIQITSLPALPAGLQELHIDRTALTGLPALPADLRILNIHNTPLVSLRTLPVRLSMVNIINTYINRPPENIGDLFMTARVSLMDNPLSERAIQTLSSLTNRPDYVGPRIIYNMVTPIINEPEQPRALNLAVADWLTPTEEQKAAFIGRWRAIEQEENAAAFSSFLDKLRYTQNFHGNTEFKAQVSSLLIKLPENNELRTNVFATAMESTSSCEDRVTITLNSMLNVVLVHDAQQGVYDTNPAGLVSNARQMFRLEKLEDIARNKVKTMRLADEIEVYLGYQNRLRIPLGLKTVTQEMRFFGASYLNSEDLKIAEMEVKTAENSQFRQWILQWGPMQSVIKRNKPEHWQRLCDKKSEGYEVIYQDLYKTELVAGGLTGDQDAERAIGSRALEAAEKAFQEGLRPEVEQMLAGHLESPWQLT